VEKITSPEKQVSEGFSLAKIKLFHRLSQEKPTADTPTRKKERQEHQKKQTKPQMATESSTNSSTEYNETLYSKEFTQKKTHTITLKKQQPTHRVTWENTETIEHNIDTMDIKQSGDISERSPKEYDTEKKVDFILLKKKK
jgi:plastocyanin